MKFKCTFKHDDAVPSNFTGMCKTSHDNAVNFVKDGKWHNEFGPAIIYPNGWQGYYYQHSYYGSELDFTIKNWITYIYNKKLEIFK